jgi:hypothetical protein
MMVEQISSEVRGDGIKNAERKPNAGGQLFPHVASQLLPRGFRVWLDAATAAAVVKASEDGAVKAADDNSGDRESVLYSGEY